MANGKPAAPRAPRLISKSYVRATLAAATGGRVEPAAVEAFEAELVACFEELLALAVARRQREVETREAQGLRRLRPPLRADHLPLSLRRKLLEAPHPSGARAEASAREVMEHGDAPEVA